MFSHLRKKIQSSDGNVSVLPPLSEKESFDHVLGKTPSIESLESGGGLSEARSRRRDEVLKRMEAKLLDMANLLREKIEQVDELTRRQRQEKDEKERILQMVLRCSVTEPMFVLEKTRLELQKHIKDPSISIQEQEWLEERVCALDETLTKFRSKQQENVTDEMAKSSSSSGSSQPTTSISQIYSILCNGEAQLQQSQRNLFSCQTELDSTKQQLEQMRRERDVQQKWCTNVQTERDQLEADNQHWQSVARDLQLAKEDLRKQMEELTEVKQEKEADLRAAECLFSQTQDRLELLQHDYDIVKHKLAHQHEIFTSRENELQHKINMLQSHLSHWEKEGNIQGNDSDNGGDIVIDMMKQHNSHQEYDHQVKQLQTKIILLTQERGQLDETVNTVRSQLHDTKMASMDRINALECQIAKLNGKLASDTQEFTQERQSIRQVTARLEKQVMEAKSRCREMEERAAQLEQQNADLQRQCRRWQNQCKKLETESQSHSESLRDQLDQLNAERIVDRKMQDEVQLTLNAQNSRIQEMTQKVSTLNRELILTKDELSDRTNRVNQLEKERFELNLRFSELKSQMNSSSEECTKLRSMSSGMQDELASTKADLIMAEDACRNMEIRVKALEKMQENVQNECEDRVRRLQEEVAAKMMEIGHLRSETTELKKQNVDLQEEKETVLVNYESTELIQVKRELAELQSQMNDKNKTIKIQKQRLQELKKTLEKELRVQNFSPAACGVTFPPALSDSTLSSRGAMLMKNGTSSLDIPNCHEEKLDSFLSPSNENAAGDSEVLSSSGGSQLLSIQSSTNTAGLSSIENMSSINYRYLRHVVIKFLVCKESEAIHLIRALSTLLKLSEEEEELLRQTLEYRRSWFVSRPTLSGASISSQSYLQSFSSSTPNTNQSSSFVSQNR